MQYKTIVLELLKARPRIHKKLCRRRMLLPTLERYANQLKTSHDAWKDHLSWAMPGRNESQIASEALEIALDELATFLHSEFQPEDSEKPSLQGAMVFIRGRRPPA
jgi:hypothetical protein